MGEEKRTRCAFAIETDRGEIIKCDRKIKKGREYCIFHEEEKDKEDFKKEIVKYINNALKEYEKAKGRDKENIRLDFTGFIFPECTPYFKNQTFDIDIVFRNAVFKEIACFEHTRFNGSVSFEDTKFEKKADFNNARFRGFTRFSGCVFGGFAKFMATHFSGRTYFVGSEFKKTCEFTLARSESEMHFVQCRTKGVYFWAVTVTRNALVYFNKIDLSKWALAFTTGIENFLFSECTWESRIGPSRYFTLDEVLSEKGLIKYEPVIEVYRKLRANFEKNHVYGVASGFHIAEMEILRKSYSPYVWFNDFKKLFTGQDAITRAFAPIPLTVFYFSTRIDKFLIQIFKPKLKKPRTKFLSSINIYSFIIYAFIMRIGKGKKPLRSKRAWRIGAVYFLTAFKSNVGKVKTFRWFMLKVYKFLSTYGESTGKPLLLLFTTVFLFALIFPVLGFPGPHGFIKWYPVGISTAYYLSFDAAVDWLNDYLYSLALAFQNLFTLKTGAYPLLSIGQLVASIERIIGFTLGTLFILSLRRAFKR